MMINYPEIYPIGKGLGSHLVLPREYQEWTARIDSEFKAAITEKIDDIQEFWVNERFRVERNYARASWYERGGLSKIVIDNDDYSFLNIDIAENRADLRSHSLPQGVAFIRMLCDYLNQLQELEIPMLIDSIREAEK